MTTVAMLSTALFVLLCAVAALLASLSARKWADEARHSSAELIKARGRLIAVEHSAEALHASLKRLTGRFNQQVSRGRSRNVDDVIDEQDRAELDLDPDLAAELALQRAPAVSPGTQR